MEEPTCRTTEQRGTRGGFALDDDLRCRLGSVSAAENYWDFRRGAQRDGLHGLTQYPVMRVPAMQSQLMDIPRETLGGAARGALAHRGALAPRTRLPREIDGPSDGADRAAFTTFAMAGIAWREAAEDRLVSLDRRGLERGGRPGRRERGLR